MLKKYLKSQNAWQLLIVFTASCFIGFFYTPMTVYSLKNIAKDQNALTLVYSQDLEDEETLVVKKVSKDNINRIIPVESAEFQTVIFYEDNTFDIYLAKTKLPPID